MEGNENKARQEKKEKQTSSPISFGESTERRDPVKKSEEKAEEMGKPKREEKAPDWISQTKYQQ